VFVVVAVGLIILGRTMPAAAPAVPEPVEAGSEGDDEVPF
jgi:hypothetical protein